MILGFVPRSSGRRRLGLAILSTLVFLLSTAAAEARPT